MSFLFPIINEQFPKIQITVGSGDEKVKEILENDDAAINLARCLVAEFEPVNEDLGQYYRISQGSRFFVDFNERDPALHQIMQDFMLHGEYEPHTTKLVKELVKEGDVCLDVGASIGYFTLLMAKKAALVVAVEATKNQATRIARNVDANKLKNVALYNVGAWSSEKEITINANASQTEKAHAQTIDSLIGVAVDFVKMDIDGSEPEALKGMEETIKRSPNMKMVIEYYPKYIRKLDLNPQDMLDFLDKYFTYVRIGGDFEGEEYYNLLCTRRK